MPGFRNAIIGSALALGLLAPVAANAMTYVEDVTFDPGSSSLSCATGGGSTVCAEVVKVFSTPISGAAGDEFQINVTMPSRLTVPGGDTSFVFADVFDTQTPTFGGSGSLDAQSTLDMTGYLGPANPITTATIDNRAEYLAAGGFSTPSPGFSMTGLNATIDLLDSDPNPLLGVTVGYAVSVPEPDAWALLLFGVALAGAGLRWRRRRDAAMAPTLA